MEKLVATVRSLYICPTEESGGKEKTSIQAEIDGIVGDRHRSYVRKTWPGERQVETTRRNERQWSAVSFEELTGIEKTLDLSEQLEASHLSANICIEGIEHFSKLPKGTLLKFPSGAELLVEEYNPPCHYMGKKIAALYKTNSGKKILTTAFSKASKLSRGLVGVVEVPGPINAGDEVSIIIYKTPA